jgi:hypothetical protein
VWQVRFKLWDQRWHRCSTRHRDQHMAVRAAGDIYDRAKFCEAAGVPLTTRRFAAVAALTLQALDSEIEQGVRPMTNRDYQRVINKYLVPFFGKYLLTSIDATLVREYEVWRNQRMGYAPQASTLMTHAAAYRRVWDTAVQQRLAERACCLSCSEQTVERLAQRQKSVGLSLEEAIAAQLPQPVFALDEGSQPFGLAGILTRLLAAAGIAIRVSGAPCKVCATATPLSNCWRARTSARWRGM